MNFDKESKSGKIFFFFFCVCVCGWGGGGGGGGGGEYEHRNRHILYIRHIVTISSTEPYSLMKIFQMIFKPEGIVALTNKGK